MSSPSVPYIVRRPIPMHLGNRAVCPGTVLMWCDRLPEWTVMHPVEGGMGHPAMCDEHAEVQLLHCQAGRCGHA